jgi:hypothetical protein
MTLEMTRTGRGREVEENIFVVKLDSWSAEWVDGVNELEHTS